MKFDSCAAHSAVLYIVIVLSRPTVYNAIPIKSVDWRAWCVHRLANCVTLFLKIFIMKCYNNLALDCPTYCNRKNCGHLHSFRITTNYSFSHRLLVRGTYSYVFCIPTTHEFDIPLVYYNNQNELRDAKHDVVNAKRIKFNF